jgi:hypothetical protein
MSSLIIHREETKCAKKSLKNLGVLTLRPFVPLRGTSGCGRVRCRVFAVWEGQNDNTV